MQVRTAPALQLKRSGKAGLLEMAIAGECFQNAAFVHDDKTDAVDYSPLFIQALTIKLPAFSA
ncbi:MAG: hypothetical protein ACLQVL_15335 [Terriglobia bacterium]